MLKEAVVPALLPVLLKVTPLAGALASESVAWIVEYWLNPAPVKVKTEEAVPGTMAVVSLVAVIVGATVAASPTAKPPVKVNDAPLPPAPAEGLVIVTLCSAIPAPDATPNVAVIEEALAVMGVPITVTPVPDTATVAPG